MKLVLKRKKKEMVKERNIKWQRKKRGKKDKKKETKKETNKERK